MTIPLLLVLVTSALNDVPDNPVPVSPIEKAATATIELRGFPDWLEIGFGSLWVSNPGNNLVQRIDLKTNRVVAEVKINKPVAAITTGFGSVWVASRGDKSVVRIDAKTNKVTASVPVTVADSEGSIAAGEGGVWVLTEKKGVLSRIDPETNKVAAEIAVKSNSFAAMAGHGTSGSRIRENRGRRTTGPSSGLIRRQTRLSPPSRSGASRGFSQWERERSGCSISQTEQFRGSTPRRTRWRPRSRLESRASEVTSLPERARFGSEATRFSS